MRLLPRNTVAPLAYHNTAIPCTFSDPLLDQDGHAGGSGHDLVIVAGRLADHVDDGRAMLVGDENSPDSLANPEPDPMIEAEGSGDVHEGGLQVAPVSLLDRRLPGPAGCRQELALAPAIAPAHDLEPPITPDRQPGPAVAIEKADFALASTLVSAAIEPVSCNQLRGQLAPCQGNSDTHGLLEWPLATSHHSKTYLSSNITNIISIGDVAVDGRQVERGGATEGEPAMAVVDLLLEQGDGLGPGPLLGRVEEVQRVLAAGGKVLGDQVHVAGLDAGQPRLAQTGAGRLEQEVEPIAGNRQRSLAEAGMAGLVLDGDRQLARGHAVEPQLLD